MSTKPPELRYLGIYATCAELGGGARTSTEDVINTLRSLSVYDCIRVIGGLSRELHLNGTQSADTQLRIINYLAKNWPKLHRRLTEAVRHGDVVVFEQQLVHMCRLAVLHADSRPPDGFCEGRRAGEFLFCLFGITDQFEDDLQDTGNREEVLSWALRQAGLNHRDDQLILWSIYYEVFCHIWPQLPKAGMPDVEAAFRRYTGLSITKYMTIGFGLVGACSRRANPNGLPQTGVDPGAWFSTTDLTRADGERFFKQSGASLEVVRDALRDETARRGETTFRSLALERMPILLGPDDTIYVMNVGALERRATHGLFHILAEGATSEGFDREHFTSPFGVAFQQWAENCLTRTRKHSRWPPEVFTDISYGPKGMTRRTPDVVLRFNHALVAVEVVAGPLQAQTVTRGDLDAFERDLDKLIFKKADQLTDRLKDIESGRTAEIGITGEGIERYWPVIVTATPFPHTPVIMEEIRQRLKLKGLLQGRSWAPLTIISAEELALAEAHMEAGASFLDLLLGWKSDRRSRDYWFKNYLWERANQLGIKRRPSHHASVFEQACEEMRSALFTDASGS